MVKVELGRSSEVCPPETKLSKMVTAAGVLVDSVHVHRVNLSPSTCSKCFWHDAHNGERKASVHPNMWTSRIYQTELPLCVCVCVCVRERLCACMLLSQPFSVQSCLHHSSHDSHPSLAVCSHSSHTSWTFQAPAPALRPEVPRITVFF